MRIQQEKLAKILVDADYVNEDDIKEAKKYSKSHKDSTIVGFLLSKDLITPDLVGQAVAEYYKVPYADLNSAHIRKDQVLKIPEDVAKKHRVVLFSDKDDEKVVATDSPNQKGLESALSKILGKKIKIAYSLSEDIDAVFINYRKALDTRFSKIIEKKKRIAPEIIDEIIEDALVYKASDIHFDPHEDEVIVRFRIDGIMQEAGRIPSEHYLNILNRIKVQAKLRIDEHSTTQDGAIRYEAKNQDIDMRISVAPVLDGEKVTIRLLAEYVKDFNLGSLGLSAKDQAKVVKASKKPFGMVLVTGPTGSGKTTTLYSLVKYMNSPEINITTIEDPVEYKIAGVNQMQVNKDAGITFSKGLRSIVRQDPDVILVGEVRDTETSEISVNAALTGHLVFSTFHANNAATTVPRLLDMGIEPFLLSSTLEVVISQRLLRRICENCKFSYSASKSSIEQVAPGSGKYFSGDRNTLYKGKGCPACNSTGYKGRTAIFELVYITKEMKDLILTNPSTQDVWKLARKQGSRSLFEDGMEKVKTGVTTIEDLTRVAEPTE